MTTYRKYSTMRNCQRKKRKNNPASKGTPWGCGHLHVVGPVSRLKKAHACMKGLALFRRKTLFLRSFVCPSPAPCSRRRFTGFESKSILLSDVTAKYTFFVSAVGAFCALPCPFLFAAPGWGSKSASGFCLHGQGACLRSPFVRLGREVFICIDKRAAMGIPHRGPFAVLRARQAQQRVSENTRAPH